MTGNIMQAFENANTFKIEPGILSAERSGALGKYAKSVDERKIASARSDRWELKKAVEKLLPGSRTARCCRDRLPQHKDSKGNWIKGSSEVRIYQSKENGSTYYGGLETCACVWYCPLCAAKISERRRQDLLAMRASWKSKGGILRLMTLTFPHGSHDKLVELLDKFAKARKKLFSSKHWREWSTAVNLIHKIYALEVTHGDKNGWHVHLHCVLFIMPEVNAKEPQALDILQAWKHACVSSGLGKPNQHGVDIRDGEAATNYITKWGLDLELTKQHTKHGREGHSTPFDLLRAYANGDSKAGLLFQEFARAFKGKRQIILSRGLRKALGVGPEKTDQELAEEDTDNADCIAIVSIREWNLILKHNLRFALLEEARLRGLQGVRQFLEILSTA